MSQDPNLSDEICGALAVYRLTGKADAAQTEDLCADPFGEVMNAIGIRRLPFFAASTFELSQEAPILISGGADGDLIPIDELLGTYNPDATKETLFEPNIYRYAPVVGSTPEALATVVRYHENGHVAVHRGISGMDHDVLIAENQKNEAQRIVDNRHDAYNGLSEEAHEFLAQLLAWLVIQVQPDLRRRTELETTYLELMKRQREVYRIPEQILEASKDLGTTTRRLRLILNLIWGTPDELKKGHNLSRVEMEAIMLIDFV